MPDDSIAMETRIYVRVASHHILKSSAYQTCKMSENKQRPNQQVYTWLVFIYSQILH